MLLIPRGRRHNRARAPGPGAMSPVFGGPADYAQALDLDRLSAGSHLDHDRPIHRSVERGEVDHDLVTLGPRTLRKINRRSRRPRELERDSRVGPSWVEQHPRSPAPEALRRHQGEASRRLDVDAR
jgi:hypothetical protein